MQVHHYPRLHFLLPILTMSEKNLRTPRTLAECEFVTGYPIADLTPQKGNWLPYICAALVVGIIWIAR